MSTVSPNATDLPAFHPAVSHPMPRRSFLAGLARLPLLGGSVALIGQPRGVAEAATPDMLEAYKTWLEYERRALCWELAQLPDMVAYYGGTPVQRFDYIERLTLNFGTGDASSYHSYDGSSPASGRAALVLSTVGCDWRDDEAPSDWLLPLRRA